MIGLTISMVALGGSMFLIGAIGLPWSASVSLAMRITGGMLLAAAATAWSYASWRKISGARLSDHSAFVEVVNAHDAFTAQVDYAKQEAARQAVWSGQRPAETQPQRLLGPLSTLWYLALVAGILLVGMALFALPGPQCSAVNMQPGDLCEITENGRTTVSTYAEEQASVRLKMVGGAVGIVLIVVSGIRIRRWNSALKRAYAEASGSAVV